MYKRQDFKDAYQQDPINAVRELTAHLAEKMKELIIETIDEEEDALILKVETIQQTEEPLPLDRAFERSKKTIVQLRSLEKTDPVSHQNLKQNIQAYFSVLDQFQMKDEMLINEANQNSFISRILKILRILMGFPFFLYGWLNNLLAYSIPLIVLKKLKLYNGYDSAVKAMVGLITFPLFYLLQSYVVQVFGNNIFLTLFYLLSLYPLGRFAWIYSTWFKKWRMSRRVRNFLQNKQNDVNQLFEKRKTILKHLSELPILTSIQSS